MKTRSSLCALLFIVGGNVITAMEPEVAQNTKSNQQHPSSQLFVFTSDLAGALQKRLEANPKDNIIHRYRHKDDPSFSVEQAIKIFSQKVNSSKKYILHSGDFQHPNQNIFYCSMFDVATQQWIHGQKIVAHQDKDIEILVPDLYYLNHDKYYPSSFTPDMKDSSFAIVNMHDLNVPPILCGKLAQGLKARGIPVVFNINKALSDVLFSPDLEIDDYTLSLFLNGPKSYETGNTD